MGRLLLFFSSLFLVACSGARYSNFTKINVQKNALEPKIKEQTNAVISSKNVEEIGGISIAMEEEALPILIPNATIAINFRKGNLAIAPIDSPGKAAINSNIIAPQRQMPTLNGADYHASPNNRSQTATILVCCIGGFVGLHRYYLGYYWTGFFQTITLGGLFLWWVIDMFRIFTNNLKPKNGIYTDWEKNQQEFKN